MRKEFSTAVHHHSVWKTPTIVSFFIVSKVKPNHFQLKTRETNEKRAVQSLFIFYLAWEIERPRGLKLLFYSWPTTAVKKSCWQISLNLNWIMWIFRSYLLCWSQHQRSFGSYPKKHPTPEWYPCKAKMWIMKHSVVIRRKSVKKWQKRALFSSHNCSWYCRCWH